MALIEVLVAEKEFCDCGEVHIKKRCPNPRRVWVTAVLIVPPEVGAWR